MGMAASHNTKFLLTSVTVIALATVLISLAGEGVADGAVGEQMIYQCDFDENIGSGFAVDPYDCGATLSKDRPHSGVYCLSCQGNRDHLQYFGLVESLPLMPGRTYKLTVWSRINGTPLTLIHVFFHKKGKMSSPLRGARMQVPPSEEWRENDLVFTVPPEFDGGELRFRFSAAAPEVVGCFDDLTISLLPPGLKAEYHCSSRKQVVTVVVNVADYVEKVSLDQMALEVALVSVKTGEKLAGKTVTGLPSLVSDVEFPIDQLPGGEYEIVTSLRGLQDELLDSVKLEDFRVFRDPEWAGNKLGMLTAETGPPPPWPPVECEDNRVTCWGREYALSDMALPEAIRVQGKEILAGPVRLIIGDGTTNTEMTLSKSRHDSLQATFTASGVSKGLELRAKAEIEFDGMMKYTVGLIPKNGETATVESLSLEVPFKRQTASLLQMVLQASSWDGGLTADLAKEPSWELREFWPHVWIGNEDRGLAWFAESDKGWRVDKGPHFQTKAEGDVLRFVVNIIDTPTEIKRPLRLVFGLQATPTRPPHPRWKDIRFRTKSIPTNADVRWSNAAYDKYYGFPLAADDPTAFKELLASCEYPLRLMYLRHCDEGVPEFRYYEDRWKAPGTVYSLEDSGFHRHMFPVDSTDPLWQDFIVSRIHDWIAKWNINGMYHDCFGPNVKDGTVRIFAFRELAKRVYTMHRRLCPEALTIVFAQPYVPLISFSDAMLSGEMYRHSLAQQEYYPAFMSLPEFRVESVISLGPARMILPQYKIAYRDSLPHSVHAMGMFFLHDLTVYASWFRMDVYDDLETRRIRFGRAESIFHPYWGPAGRVTVHDEGLRASYYEKPSGGLLITLANVSPNDVADTIEVDLRGLRGKRETVLYDPLTQTESTVALGSGGSLPVKVKAYMMLLIQVGE